MPRGRIIRGSTSVYFFLAEKTSHSRCRSDENKKSFDPKIKGR
ncbi:hypothetical protein CU026_2662 [Enterococcus faecium]|uniref:Uncharacterized protein n=3 Tax=Enterococcus faecium TaxID=1352 RepID=A0A1B5FVU4_ENTFC|nr:hypothetical protein HMPREF0351_12279 [Enterococcus faecium DO]AGE30902.1 hypothetical protein M7W_2303 [Enterococcus faecium ATCC 8459 = NRRL B-2354]APV55703.1 hypothetical protein AL026_13565 [Enterococcus faecium]EFF21546.1 hypothetical protein EfmE1071_0306 [Enterococcus faecium E1071]EFF22307.1 hypothetical protein EfmE1636_2608 [Enterococcus faecium E1636]EFF26272.1 hypothetical protein EfmE1679_1699 [Enterococcus faecium E1679]EFF28162.1 hypothetical protein EfmU0317_2865 [Enterococ